MYLSPGKTLTAGGKALPHLWQDLASPIDNDWRFSAHSCCELPSRFNLTKDS
jgi:hypothetical protein